MVLVTRSIRPILRATTATSFGLTLMLFEICPTSQLRVNKSQPKLTLCAHQAINGKNGICSSAGSANSSGFGLTSHYRLQEEWPRQSL